MALKTFNINEKIYKEFSKHCKSQGHSMSKKIENFIRSELEKINSLNKINPKTEDKELESEHPLHKYC